MPGSVFANSAPLSAGVGTVMDVAAIDVIESMFFVRWMEIFGGSVVRDAVSTRRPVQQWNRGTAGHRTTERSE